MNSAPTRHAGRPATRALVATLACLAVLLGPRRSRAQCEPAPRRVDPLAQAVAKMHAPKPVPHAAPRRKPAAAPLVTRVARVRAPAASRPAVPARPAVSPRRKPVAHTPRVQPKRAPRPVACRTDSTMGLPLPVVGESFGAVPESPFVAEMVASQDGPTLAGLRPLRPLAPKPIGPRIPVVGSLPGSAPGVATGITIAAAGAGGVAWHFFWRPVGDPMRWHTDDHTPGGKPPVGVPPIDPPGQVTPPAGKDDQPAGDPAPPRDSITTGGVVPVGGGNGGDNGGGNGGGDPWPDGPPGSGDPLFPDPIPGLPFPEIPTERPLGPPGGPSGGPPAGPQSSVPEPATGGLIAAGAIAIGLAYARKRRGA